MNSTIAAEISVLCAGAARKAFAERGLEIP
jgi:hypothetical protein